MNEVQSSYNECRSQFHKAPEGSLSKMFKKQKIPGPINRSGLQFC